MSKLRPARTMRNPNSQAWARYSLRKPKKNYIRALPHIAIEVFKSGTRVGGYDSAVSLLSEQPIQLRSNAIEAARKVANKHMENALQLDYYMRLCVYPHNVIREHKVMAGAGADRLSRGMHMVFGRPTSVAARLQTGQKLFEIHVSKNNIPVAKAALKKAISKLSGNYKIRAEEMAASKTAS